MAKINWNELKARLDKTQDQQNSFNDGVRVGYFSLKNDKDSALVRIMHEDENTFDMLSVHKVTEGGKFRTVNCPRNAKVDPIEMCPLCASGSAVAYKIYVHLLEYVFNDDGTVTVEPKVWERPQRFAQTLSSYMTDYGDLSNCIFKIRRNGQAGSRQVSYDLIYQPNEKLAREYPGVQFIKDDEAFNNFQALGRMVLNKDYEGMLPYVKSEDGAVSTPKYNNGGVDNNNFIPYQPKKSQYYSTEANPKVLLTQPRENNNYEEAPRTVTADQTGFTIRANGVANQTSYPRQTTPTQPTTPVQQPTTPTQSQPTETPIIRRRTSYYD